MNMLKFHFTHSLTHSEVARAGRLSAQKACSFLGRLFKFHSPQQEWPRNRTSGRLLFPILALTAILCLPHCTSDDNGGGGSGGNGGPTDTDTDPSPLSAIYLWLTNCTSQGNMRGSACNGRPPATAPANGLGRADAICQASYEMDVSEADRMRIAGEAEVGETGVQHRALLATEDSMGGLPQSFDIHGKDSLPIQRPDGTTAIAASYSDFFTLDTPTPSAVGVGVVITTVWVWTGLDNSLGLGNHCGKWMSTSGNASVARGDNVDNTRLHALDFGPCGDFYRLLCITH